MISLIILLVVITSVVLHHSVLVALFMLSAIIVMVWQQTGSVPNIIYTLMLTAIISIAVIFMPKIERVDAIDGMTVVGYKYYKDDIVHIVQHDGQDYELYTEDAYDIGTVCMGQYEVNQPNIQRNFIKQDADLRMLMNDINGRIYEDTSLKCAQGNLTVGMRINSIRDSYIKHVLSATEHDYKFDMLTLSIGNKSYIDSEFFDGLQKLGIYHLFVISGTHVAFVTGVLYFVLKRMRIPLEYIKVILICFLIGFLLLNLFSPSVFRAVCMAVILLTTSFFKERPYITVISLTALLQILIAPHMTYNAGFQLSYVTTCFIILTRHYWLDRKPFMQLLSITVISEVSTLLLILLHFNEISISGIVMNLFFVPLFSLVVFPSVILFNLLMFIGLSPLFDAMFHLLFSYLKMLIMFLSNVVEHRIAIVNLHDFAIIILIAVTFTMTMLICRFDLRRLLISVAVFVITIVVSQNVTFNDFKVTMVDVGQGDSFIIQDLKHRKVLIIDTGGRFYQEEPHIRLSDQNILPYLKEQGVNKIDVLMLSHIDLDHSGEFDHIQAKKNISYVLANTRDPAFREFWDYDVPLIDMYGNRQFKLGNIEVMILYPFDETVVADSNDSSIVALIRLGDFQFLFTGDVSTEVEAALIRKYDLRGIDILKVGHHGSSTSTSERFVEALDPSLGLISAGVDNRYGHPHPEVVDVLDGVKILGTYETGMVELLIRGNRMCIEGKLIEINQCVVK